MNIINKWPFWEIILLLVVKILGLKILPIALKNDTNMINEFSDFLVESFRTTDIQIKKTVL